MVIRKISGKESNYDLICKQHRCDKALLVRLAWTVFIVVV